MKRYAFILVILAILACLCLPAEAQTSVSNRVTTVGEAPACTGDVYVTDYGIGANAPADNNSDDKCHTAVLTATCTGTVKRLCVRFGNLNDGAENANLVLYSDSSSDPNEPLASVVVTGDGDASYHYHCGSVNYAVTASTDYWLGWCTDEDNSDAYYSYDAVGDAQRAWNLGAADYLDPGTWNTSVDATQARAHAAYISYDN